MTAVDILEMLDEHVVHRCTAEGADEGQGLRGNLLRDHQSEACSDLGDELQQDGRTLLEDAAFGDETGRLPSPSTHVNRRSNFGRRSPGSGGQHCGPNKSMAELERLQQQSHYVSDQSLLQCRRDELLGISQTFRARQSVSTKRLNCSGKPTFPRGYWMCESADPQSAPQACPTPRIVSAATQLLMKFL
jgi:hypothetical protein